MGPTGPILPALPGAAGPSGLAATPPSPPPAPERRVLPVTAAEDGALDHALLGRSADGHNAPPSRLQIALTALLREQTEAARRAEAEDSAQRARARDAAERDRAADDAARTAPRPEPPASAVSRDGPEAVGEGAPSPAAALPSDSAPPEPEGTVADPQR